MAKGHETGNTFLAGVLQRLSPEDRQKGEELIAQMKALGGGAVVTAVGDGVLAQSEFSSQMDRLNADRAAVEAAQAELEAVRVQQQETYRQQTEWWQGNQANLQELERLRKAGMSNGNGHAQPAAVPKGVVTEEQLEAFRRDLTGAFLGFDQDKSALQREHFQMFGEIPDLSPLLQHPQIRDVGLKGVYQQVFKDRLDAHAKAEEKKREDAIRADERRKLLESQATMPYPMAGEAAFEAGSPLDALTKTDQVADAASAHYRQILSERAAGRA